jgi:hypothetical protein
VCAARTERELDQRRAPRQQRSRDRIEAILDTTSALLADVGVDRLTTVMIANEIGTSVGSLYHFVEPLVAEHYPAFRDRRAAERRPLPRYVEAEFDPYLKCGLLEHGFLRVKCDACQAE